jgi:hypothetical protein
VSSGDVIGEKAKEEEIEGDGASATEDGQNDSDYNYKDSAKFSTHMQGKTQAVSNFALSRWCECSCDVHLCYLLSAHANLTTNMQLHAHSQDDAAAEGVSAHL